MLQVTAQPLCSNRHEIFGRSFFLSYNTFLLDCSINEKKSWKAPSKSRKFRHGHRTSFCHHHLHTMLNTHSEFRALVKTLSRRQVVCLFKPAMALQMSPDIIETP